MGRVDVYKRQSLSSAGTMARSADSIICMECRGRPLSDKLCAIMRPMAVLECSDSLPPRRMTALPLLRHNAAASLVTLGRLS